jgi:hypothetical protein
MKALSQIAEFKQYIPKLPVIKRKRESTSLFVDLTGVLQRRLANGQDILDCERGIQL